MNNASSPFTCTVSSDHVRFAIDGAPGLRLRSRSSSTSRVAGLPPSKWTNRASSSGSSALWSPRSWASSTA
jgi:hypothetical protein